MNKLAPGIFQKIFSPDLVFILFVSTVFASVTLPLFPFWGVLIICLSLSIVGLNHRNSLVLISSLTVFASLSLPYLGNWVAALANEPLSLAKNSLLFSSGLPLGEIETALLNLALTIPTITICYLNIRGDARWFYIVVLLASIFLAAHTFSPLINYAWPPALRAATANKVQQLLLLAAACPYFFKQSNSKQLFLNAIIGSAALIASVTLLQFILRDFSYVLTAINVDDYFYRVRASYYYHAPSAQFLAICFPIVCSFALYKQKNLILYAFAIVIFLALYLNGTRATGLSVVAGFTVMAIMTIMMRGWKHRGVLIFFAVAIVFSTTVFYVKPNVGVGGTTNAEFSILSEIISSNSNRISLAAEKPSPISTEDQLNSGKSSKHSNVVSADGPMASGERYPISGYESQLNHIPLNSSHILFLDLANNTGIATLVLILLAFAIVVTTVYVKHFRFNKTKDEFFLDNGVVGALIVFTVSTFFFPFEKNWTIYLVVILAGILVQNTFSSSNFEELEQTYIYRTVRNVCTLIACAVVGFVILWSPSYVFPAVEFTARYKQLLKDEKISIFVTSDVMKGILGTSLALQGNKNRVLMLADNSAELPQDRNFIIWNPADEIAYPNLRRELGIAHQLAYRQWMSVKLQPNWCIQNNFLPSVQFITVGFQRLDDEEQICGGDE